MHLKLVSKVAHKTREADLIAVEEAREAWALTRSHGASDDPLSPPTPQNWGIHGVLRRAWDVSPGIWGSNPALICPYDDSGPSVRLVGCLNARAGCRYHEMLISVRFLKTAIFCPLDQFWKDIADQEIK